MCAGGGRCPAFYPRSEMLYRVSLVVLLTALLAVETARYLLDRETQRTIQHVVVDSGDVDASVTGVVAIQR